MGLGLYRPELALIPLGLIFLWVAVELVWIRWAMRTVDRTQRRRAPWLPGRKRSRFEEEPAAPVMSVCKWCGGKGALHPTLAATLGVISPNESYEPECPNCDGAGYVDATPDARKRKALRRKLVHQEWKE